MDKNLSGIVSWAGLTGVESDTETERRKFE